MPSPLSCCGPLTAARALTQRGLTARALEGAIDDTDFGAISPRLPPAQKPGAQQQQLPGAGQLDAHDDPDRMMYRLVAEGGDHKLGQGRLEEARARKRVATAAAVAAGVTPPPSLSPSPPPSPSRPLQQHDLSLSSDAAERPRIRAIETHVPADGGWVMETDLRGLATREVTVEAFVSSNALARSSIALADSRL